MIILDLLPLLIVANGAQECVIINKNAKILYKDTCSNLRHTDFLFLEVTGIGVSDQVEEEKFDVKSGGLLIYID